MRPLLNIFNTIATDRQIWCSHDSILTGLTWTKQHALRLTSVKHYIEFNRKFIAHCQYGCVTDILLLDPSTLFYKHIVNVMDEHYFRSVGKIKVAVFYNANNVIFLIFLFIYCRFVMPSFGLRTVDKIDNVTGILGYSVGFVVDSAGGVGLSDPPEYMTVPPKEESHAISIPATDLNDGDTVVIWLTVSDMAGNRDEVRLSVGLDRTPPRITGDDFQTKTVDDFTSRYGSFP